MSCHRLSRVLCVVLSSAMVMSADAQSASPSPVQAMNESIPKELEGYHERLVEIMEKLHVPGFAVDGGRGDKTLDADALGERGVENTPA